MNGHSGQLSRLATTQGKSPFQAHVDVSFESPGMTGLQLRRRPHQQTTLSVEYRSRPFCEEEKAKMTKQPHFAKF